MKNTVMKNPIPNYCTVLLCSLLLGACSNSENVDAYSDSSVSRVFATDKALYEIEPLDRSIEVTLSTNLWWRLESVTTPEGEVAAWIESVTPEGGRMNGPITVACLPNYTATPRTALFTLAPDGESSQEPITFRITQKASAPFLQIESEEMRDGVLMLGVVGSQSILHIHANKRWTADLSEVSSWFSLNTTEGGGEDTHDVLTANYSGNADPEQKPRTGEITFRDETGAVLCRLAIEQSGFFAATELTVVNNEVLEASWTQVSGAVSYELILTDINGGELAHETYDTLPEKVDLAELFTRTDYSGIFRAVVRTNSIDPDIFSISSAITTHSHFAEGSGDGTPGSELLITALRHLNNINVTGLLSANYRQTADLDFAGGSYNPVGTPAKPFTGCYDGGNYAVRNAVSTLDSTSERLLGLFGVISKGGKLSDLHFEACRITVGKATNSAPCGVGHAAGACDGGTVSGITAKNCTIDVSKLNTALGVGGIVGGAYGEALISDCSVRSESVGIFVARPFVDAPQAGFLGGILGGGQAGVRVERCANEGMAIESGHQITGGIVGQNASVSGCYNRAPIIGKSATGGIVGDINKGQFSITGCYNTAQIDIMKNNAMGGAAGILGRIAGTPSERADISCCFNSGTLNITLQTRPIFAGGIVGDARQGNLIVADCFNTADITVVRNNANNNASFAGGIVGNFNNSSAAIDKKVQNCYSTGVVGGTDAQNGGLRCALVGTTTGAVIVSDLFYTDSAEAIGGKSANRIRIERVTETQLGDIATFSDPSWDFVQRWSAPTGTGPYAYPQLRGIPYIAGN